DAEMAAPRVVARSFLADQPLLLETPQDAAEVTRVETKLFDQVARCRLFAMRQLVQHARLAQREGRLQKAVLQDAETLRVKAVESADSGTCFGRDHDCTPT